MSTPALAAVFLGLAAACYILGLWVGRRTARDDFAQQLDLALALRRREELKREARARDRVSDRYRLAWLSARRRAHRGRLLEQLLDEDTTGAYDENLRHIGYANRPQRGDER